MTEEIKKDVKSKEIKKIGTAPGNPSKYVEINPMIESFVGEIIAGSEDQISSDEEYTYADLLRAVIDNDLEDFEEMVGGDSEDLFAYIYGIVYDGDYDADEDEDEDEVDEIDYEANFELGESFALSIAQRRRRAQVMRKYKGKIAAARRRASRRKASPEKLKARAKRKARDLIRQRFTAGQNYGSMGDAQKVQVDKRLARIPDSVIARIAQRQLPKVRQAEQERMIRRGNLKQSYETIGELIEDTSDINKLFESKFG